MRLDTLPSEPFASAAEHMAAEFRWLDARIAAHLRGLREEDRFDESEMRGLRLDERPVLAALSPARRAGETPLDRLREIIDQRAAAGPPPPLYRIAESFGLSPIERSALLVAAAPALDNRYRASLALAQNDATRSAATPDLLIELLDPAGRFDLLGCFTPDAPLMRHRLLRFADPRSNSPLADRAIAVDDRLVLALLGRIGGLPEALAQALEPLDPAVEDWAPDLLELPRVARPVWLFDSARDNGQRALAARRAAKAGRPLLRLDLDRLADTRGEEAGELLALAVREALLRDALLYVESGALDRASPLAAATVTSLACADCQLVVSAPAEIGHRIWQASPARAERIALAPLDAVERLTWWQRAARDPGDPHVAHLAWRSRLGPTGIGRSCRDDLAPAAIPQRPLPAMLRPVRSLWQREDLVLSDVLARQLDELTAFVSNWPQVLGEWGYAQSNPQSRHCLALFSGPSGTGKTMAAGIVAAAAELPLYRASLASIFDKYIGETEKQIDRLFEAAADAGIALLCDEADALFAARSESTDVHARYSNLTVAYLLQRIEEHEGLVILTSNLPRNMDEAFARRIGHSLAFTLPDMPGRLKLWRRAIPERARVAGDVDFASLAETFELSGGDIRNASLAAAYLAAAANEPIGMKHLLRAIERELEKAGRTPIAADFGRLGSAR
jgi:hypothetical protein